MVPLGVKELPESSDQWDMIKSPLASLLILMTLSCTQASRNVASLYSPPDLNDLLIASEEILQVVESPAFDSKLCKTYLAALEKNIDQLELKKFSMETLKNQGQRIAHTSWQIRTIKTSG